MIKLTRGIRAQTHQLAEENGALVLDRLHDGLPGLRALRVVHAGGEGIALGLHVDAGGLCDHETALGGALGIVLGHHLGGDSTRSTAPGGWIWVVS